MLTGIDIPNPRVQDTNGPQGINPVETDAARVALVEAYKALRVLRDGGLLAFVAENAHDPAAAEQANEAIATVENSMSPNLLCTVLPAYTKVRFATDRSREGETQEGLLRDGAWGLYPEREGSTERRITTNGWEFFVGPDTVFTYFEVVERG